MSYHHDIFQELAYIIKSDKIPNAFLFTGDSNSGRKEAAFFLAKGCNCLSTDDVPCNRCQSCKKIDRQTHPDIIKIQPEKGKKIIPISGIRNISAILASRPNEARHRMVLIDEAHAMNPQAQNALLKMLEEPPQSTFFVLTARDGPGLLPTILSRCRKIGFTSLNCKAVAERLLAEFNIDPRIAYIVSETVGPDYEKALSCLNLKEDETNNWLHKRQWLLQTLMEILMPAKGYNPASKILLLAQALNSDSDFLEDGMAVIRSFFRDIIMFGLYPEKIVNQDFSAYFSDISRQFAGKQGIKCLELFFETEKKIQSNCGVKLSLETFFLNVKTNGEEKAYG